jgi:hypothetical protein
MRLARKNKTKRKGFIDARSDDDTEEKMLYRSD